MDLTTHLDLPRPNVAAQPPRNVSEEFPRLAVALDMLDAIIHSLQNVVANKAAANHEQAMSTITGLVDALAGKMPIDRSFVLDDLADVEGAEDAAVNYVLVKNANGNWVPSSALAAIGEHQHSLDEVLGLEDALVDLQNDLAQVVSTRMRFLNAGAALPTVNEGPIWHADYGSVMTWQVFNANGANYAGYASTEIGMPVLDGRSTPRTGYLKRNGASLSKVTFAPLFNWALHNGLVVPFASWTSGFMFADNGDGTFRVPDNRAEFDRAWDDGRGVDAGRVFGSAQASQNLSHAHGISDPGHTHLSGAYNSVGTNASGLPGVHNSANHNAGYVSGILNAATGISILANGGTEARPRNIALLACIKF